MGKAADDPRQTGAADAFIAAGVWVSLLVLAETVWVLAAIHRMRSHQLHSAIAGLLQHETIIVQEPEAVAAALEQFGLHPALGFTDCLAVEVARRAGHLPFGTFDRNLAKAAGAIRL